MSALWLVSGERGLGKTTFCGNVAQEWAAAGRDVAGLLSLAVFAQEIKTGIDVVNLRSGERRRLANLRTTEAVPAGELSTLRWRFDPEVMAWGNEVLAQTTPCDLLVVDELGPLEFEREQGWLNGLRVLDGGQYQLALVVIRPELLDVALARWPGGIVKQIQRRLE